MNAASKSFSVLSISWRGPRVKSRSESSGPQNISPTTINACLVKTVGEGPARLELLKLQDLFTSGVTGWKADFRYMDCESLARVEPGGFEEVCSWLVESCTEGRGALDLSAKARPPCVMGSTSKLKNRIIAWLCIHIQPNSISLLDKSHFDELSTLLWYHQAISELPFTSFWNEAWCSTIQMKMSLICMWKLIII